MNSVYLLAPAKINLYLEIVGDRLDGYHELVMLMQAIELSDTLEFRLTGIEKIRLFCQDPQVPTDQTNLIYKAVNLLQKKFPAAYHNFGGVDITLNKRIPIAAGLAGGSSNAAATLFGLNLLWRLGLSIEQMQELGAQLGSDVPFCLTGGTALATGRGEKISSLPDLDKMWLIIAKYETLGISTAWAYQSYRQAFSDTYLQARSKDIIYTEPLVKAILAQDKAQIGQLLHNDLEKVVLPAYREVAKLRQAMQEIGGLGTMMSGSGPSVFTLCNSAEEAILMQQKIDTQFNTCDLKTWVTPLVSGGVRIVKS